MSKKLGKIFEVKRNLRNIEKILVKNESNENLNEIFGQNILMKIKYILSLTKCLKSKILVSVEPTVFQESFSFVIQTTEK